ncbi:MAG: hypothetical protein HY925_13225, partial [Elusimicrobia bacterium]|nr:hypothetical protein [Elusimicrobiota bacterium]
VIADAAFQEVLGVVRRCAVQLFEETLAGQRRRLRIAGKLMLADRRLRDAWQAELISDVEASRGLLRAYGAARRGLTALAAGLPPDSDRAQIVETARVTRWFRNASRASLAGWQKHAAKPSDRLRPAWTAPVFLDWAARPMSLLELRTSLESEGSLKWSQSPRSGASKSDYTHVVWAIGDAELETLYGVFRGASIHDVTRSA